MERRELMKLASAFALLGVQGKLSTLEASTRPVLAILEVDSPVPSEIAQQMHTQMQSRQSRLAPTIAARAPRRKERAP
jgi:hypothetical protein